MKFQKLTIMLTLTCLCVFSIIGLVLNLDANLQHHDGNTYIHDDAGWTVSASSWSTSSGACADISPNITGAGDPQAAVNYNYTGWGRAWAERDGYLSFNPFNWFDASPVDDGVLKARLKVVMADFVLNGKKVEITIGGIVIKKIKLTISLKVEFGEQQLISKLYKEEEFYTGRYANVGGGEDVSKSSGVCGTFEGQPFDHSTSYEPDHIH